jgi:ADP-ribose pyrophosphatase
MPTRRLTSVRIHQGRVFTLYRDYIELPNGVRTTLEVIRHPGAAAIVPFTAPGRVLLIRQYRYAVDEAIWEIPAGTLESGESPLECARRELAEETGFAAGRWLPLGSVTPLPAYSDETIHLFRAEDLVPEEAQADADEILTPHEFAYEETLAMIAAGTIRDAKTIAALTLAGRVTSPTVR